MNKKRTSVFCCRAPLYLFHRTNVGKTLVSLGTTLCLLSMNPLAYAVEEIHPPLVLDTVFFQVAAKHWINTQTALLSVTINATLTNADLVKARADIMEKLAKIAEGEWHVTSFNRSQDSSGLEKLYVQAQARVPQQRLTAVYSNAKAESKPGATYDVTAIDFTPSLDEVQQARDALRAKLYVQARDELARINKVYVDQHYTLNQLVFSDNDVVALGETGVMNAMVKKEAPPPLTVSNELTMTATVNAASNRKPAS